ncbi:ATP-dependent Clp protease ATP-binding subunit ClpX [Candidatus Poribacteria bacterium]|nr:ATP-dependent Clp protease ATP-binding subunit ClpX [Candidatus Poribacteria bacterium]
MRNPTFEELQKDLERLREKYGGTVHFGFYPPGAAETGEKEKQEEKPIQLNFNFKPKDIKEYLDRYVIKQDEAKKALAIAICDHYNHIMECERDPSLRDEEYSKQNIIIIGPTGVGKTYMVRLIAKLIGVPFVKADATKFSETGYVGGNVEDLVRDLVIQADGNIKLAQYGIIYLDEIDKIATAPNIIGRDVSGRGVQMNLLKLMEETEVDLNAFYDVGSQLRAIAEFQRKGKVERRVINTKHILFIVSGAFTNLKEIIKRRLNKRNIGFGADIKSRDEEDDYRYLRQVTSQDFIEFGFEPEFIGRLPVHVVCEGLNEEDLYQILKTSEGSIIKQYRRSFKAYGIEAIFSDEALREIAREAYKEGTGARGLMTVCERVMRDFKFELPSTDIKKFVVTDKVVRDPQGELSKILSDPEYNEEMVVRELLKSYSTEFFDKYGITISFDDEAVRRIAKISSERKADPNDVCRDILRDYEYGLNLIKKNSGRTEFTITGEVIEDPDGTLERWIKESYSHRAG